MWKHLTVRGLDHVALRIDGQQDRSRQNDEELYSIMPMKRDGLVSPISCPDGEDLESYFVVPHKLFHFPAARDEGIVLGRTKNTRSV